MDLGTFLEQRRPGWRELEAILARVEGSGMESLDDDMAVRFGRLYRLAASDLNQAQTLLHGESTVGYLNNLVARCYLVIYGRTSADWRGLARYLVLRYPAVFRRYTRQVLLASAFFLAGLVFGFVASTYDPQAARAYLLPSDFATIQPRGENETDDSKVLSTGQLAAFSSFLFTNNVSVSLAAFALGITFGIGTAWLLWYNGILMGALAAVFAEAGQFTAFCTGVLPHGVLELPAIIIGGAAGFVLAQGLIQARPGPRLDTLAHHGKEALFLVAGCFPLLALAAILEAGVARAPDWVLGSELKLACAGVFGLLFVTYILLLGWRKDRPLAA